MNFDVIIRRGIWELGGSTKIKMGMLFLLPDIANNITICFDFNQIRYLHTLKYFKISEIF